MADPKLGQWVISIRIIICSYHDYTTKLYLPWYPKIEDECNYPIYARFFDCKYYLIIGYHNNWIIVNFLDYETNDEKHEHTNRTVLDVNVTNM